MNVFFTHRANGSQQSLPLQIFARMDDWIKDRVREENEAIKDCWGAVDHEVTNPFCLVINERNHCDRLLFWTPMEWILNIFP